MYSRVLSLRNYESSTQVPIDFADIRKPLVNTYLSWVLCRSLAFLDIEAVINNFSTSVRLLMLFTRGEKRRMIRHHVPANSLGRNLHRAGGLNPRPYTLLS